MPYLLATDPTLRRDLELSGALGPPRMGLRLRLTNVQGRGATPFPVHPPHLGLCAFCLTRSTLSCEPDGLTTQHYVPISTGATSDRERHSSASAAR